MTITAEQFEAATGFPPEGDDLDRANCPDAGAIGHLCCGWNSDLNKPQFMIGPQPWNGKPWPMQALALSNGDRA